MSRILGIDYGLKRIGLALSDPLGIIASPYKTIPNSDPRSVLEVLQTIIQDKDVNKIVLGLPLGMKGQETEQTERTRKFFSLLETLAIPVEFQDERLSSVTAKKSLIQQDIKTGHNKALVDQRAAAIFLQQYLDIHSR
ncbi:MAG: Holliday junction resolvase RuvX [Fidelibacterota bacterium]